MTLGKESKAGRQRAVLWRKRSLSSEDGGTALCPSSYFSQQKDSLHVFIFQNIWIHLLIPIDELHQPLQLPNQLLAQPLVLNVTGEVNPATEKRPASGLLWVTSDHPNHVS